MHGEFADRAVVVAQAELLAAVLASAAFVTLAAIGLTIAAIVFAEDHGKHTVKVLTGVQITQVRPKVAAALESLLAMVVEVLDHKIAQMVYGKAAMAAQAETTNQKARPGHTNGVGKHSVHIHLAAVVAGQAGEKKVNVAELQNMIGGIYRI
jgi:hypothetical protein